MQINIRYRAMTVHIPWPGRPVRTLFVGTGALCPASPLRPVPAGTLRQLARCDSCRAIPHRHGLIQFSAPTLREASSHRCLLVKPLCSANLPVRTYTQVAQSTKTPFGLCFSINTNVLEEEMVLISALNNGVLAITHDCAKRTDMPSAN